MHSFRFTQDLNCVTCIKYSRAEADDAKRLKCIATMLAERWLETEPLPAANVIRINVAGEPSLFTGKESHASPR